MQDTWDPANFDEVVVSTLPSTLSRWLKLDLPRRVERITNSPVTHVTAPETPDAPADD